MKRLIPILIIFSLLLSLCACEGNYAKVDLQKPVAIPEDGVVEKALLDKIKSENAIATFTGASGGLEYEWTIFGSDLHEIKDINLLVTLEKADGGVKVDFAATEAFGFPALLSIHLNEKWSALAASAYQDGTAVSSVSITGSKTSILNMPVNTYMDACLILPDEAKVNSGVGANRPNSDGSATDQDKYLTNPVPEGKPLPVEPENQEINKGKTYTCTFSIECSAILNNLSDLDPDKLELVPSNGVILAPTTVTHHHCRCRLWRRGWIFGGSNDDADLQYDFRARSVDTLADVRNGHHRLSCRSAVQKRMASPYESISCRVRCIHRRHYLRRHHESCRRDHDVK